MELMEMLKGVLRVLFVTINNLYCIPTYVVWVVLLSPLALVDAALFWWVEGMLFHWLLTMVAFWSHSAQYRIVETGDEIERIEREEALLLVNHQSTSDVPLLMAAFTPKMKVLPNLNWVMDAVFKYTNFGIVSYIHGDFFINAGREKRDASILDLVGFLKERFVPRRRKWLVLFPEGGFLRKRREPSNRYCRKIGLPELINVTLPRMGAIQAIVDTIGPNTNLGKGDCGETSSLGSKHGGNTDLMNGKIQNGNIPPARHELKYIVDMTIAYPDGNPLDLVAIVTGCVPPRQVRFHYKIFPIHQVPLDKEGLQEWLYARYREKDRILGRFYESGKWEEEASTARPVEQDLLRVLLLHLVFIASTLLHISLFLRFFS